MPWRALSLGSLADLRAVGGLTCGERPRSLTGCRPSPRHSPWFPARSGTCLARVAVARTAQMATTALGVRSERAPAAAVGWRDGRTGVLA